MKQKGHPLNIANEIIDSGNREGVKTAAKRRVAYELGIDIGKDYVNALNFITRIHYKAENYPNDGIFGEHEIDYVFFVQGDFEIKKNNNEVETVKYVTSEELKQLIDDQNNGKDILLTPWFKMISNKFLFNWWSNLDNLSSIKDVKTIHHL
jgi:isopentenyl-diphosphate Delta-isomerase